MSSVTLRDLCKSFKGTVAVDSVDLEIREGEFFSILGPSGCGKSTTLRMIAGFEQISSGQIQIDGSDVSFFPPEQRNIGFVFQNYAIFPHMNVYDNVAFGLRLRKVDESTVSERVTAALLQVGMSGFEGRYQREMSGGQQQRIALARVLVTEPRILLLDEPLSALDKNLREEMKFWIKGLQESLGITTVYVTHDQGEALTMSDRIAVMHAGRVAQVGTPEDIYERPVNRFVTEFIGESNVLSVSVSEIRPDVCRLILDGNSVSAPPRAGYSADDRAGLAIRPEQFEIGSYIGNSDWNSIAARFRYSQYHGAVIRQVFQLADGQQLIAEFPNRHGVPEPQPGAWVDISWRVDCGWLVEK